ncbi:MAG: hypothetical protein DGJ47_000463 [Rickettsiaceae bacterium]
MNLKLRSERERQGYTIDEVSEILKIRRQYLIGIEENSYENMPGKTYIRGYIKVYCKFLGIEPPEYDTKDSVIKKPLIKDRKLNKYLMALIALVLVLITLVAYEYYHDCDEDEADNIISNKDLIYIDDDNQTTFNRTFNSN